MSVFSYEKSNYVVPVVRIKMNTALNLVNPGMCNDVTQESTAHAVSIKTHIGSLTNKNGNDNENATKQVLMSKNHLSARAFTFLCGPLQNNNVK